MDGQEYQTQNEKPTPHRSLLSVVIILIIVLVIGGIAWFFIIDKTDKIQDIDPFLDLKGKIYFSSSLVGETGADLYEFDIATGELKTFFDEFTDVRYTSVFSPTQTRMAYIASPLDQNSRFRFPFSEILQVFIKDQEENISKITTSTTTAKQFPAWSPDGTLLAFMGLNPERYVADNNNFYVPSEWGIFVINENNTEEQIGIGMYPQWSPDGDKILTLVNDGLALYDVSDKTGGTVWRFSNQGQTHSIMKIALSHDGKRLVWAGPHTGKLIMLQIVSWDPFEALYERVLTESIGGEKSVLLWPTFSPDDKYVAGIEVDWNYVAGTDEDFILPTNTNMRLVVYAIGDTFNDPISRKELTKLENFNFELVLLSDWVF